MERASEYLKQIRDVREGTFIDLICQAGALCPLPGTLYHGSATEGSLSSCDSMCAEHLYTACTAARWLCTGLLASLDHPLIWLAEQVVALRGRVGNYQDMFMYAWDGTDQHPFPFTLCAAPAPAMASYGGIVQQLVLPGACQHHRLSPAPGKHNGTLQGTQGIGCCREMPAEETATPQPTPDGLPFQEWRVGWQVDFQLGTHIQVASPSLLCMLEW